MGTIFWVGIVVLAVTIPAFLSIGPDKFNHKEYVDDGIDHEIVEDLYKSLHEAEINQEDSDVESIRHAIMLEELGYTITNDDIH